MPNQGRLYLFILFGIKKGVTLYHGQPKTDCRPEMPCDETEEATCIKNKQKNQQQQLKKMHEEFKKDYENLVPI